METKLCAFCDFPLTEANRSKEHLIPNALGGLKKVSNFICRRCNNDFGGKWDSALAGQLNQLAVLFGIVRARGPVPAEIVETVNGDRFRLNADGFMTPADPSFIKEPVEGGLSIRMVARSMDEARSMIDGLKRRYPQLDVDVVMQGLRWESHYVSDSLKMSLDLGGQAACSSVIKSVMCLASACGVDARKCDAARKFAMSAEECDRCFGYFYSRDLIACRPANPIFHCVAIRGSRNSRQLIGYAEYYGFQRMVIRLSSDYEGPDLAACYAIDPISGEELSIEVDLYLSREELEATCRAETAVPGEAELALRTALFAGLKRVSDREMRRVVDKAVNDAFAVLSASGLESATADQLADLAFDNMLPYLVHRISKREPSDP